MKTLKSLLLALVCGLCAMDIAHAATATWTQLVGGNATGNWNTAANPPWSLAAVPGPGDTADFSTLNIVGTSYVTLNGDRSIDALIFGDTTTTSSTGIWFFLPGTPDTSTLTLAGASPTITVNAMGSGVTAIEVPLAGTGGLTKEGAGLLTVTNNTFTGKVVVNGGTLGIGRGDTTLGAVPDVFTADAITLNGGGLYNIFRTNSVISISLNANRGLTIGTNGGFLNVNNAAQTMTVNGALTGSGTLTKNGAGKASLGAQANTFSGKFSVTAGTLAYGMNGSTLGANPPSFVADSIALNGGALNNSVAAIVNWSIPANRGVTLGANHGIFNIDSTSGNVGVTVSSVISGAGQLRRIGGGALTLSAVNTYTGGTWVTNGSAITATTGAALILGNPSALGSGAVNFVNTNSLAGLRYAGANNGVVPNNILLSTNANLTNRWSVDASLAVTFSGVVSGGNAGSFLQKDGPGTLILPAVNTLGGTVLVTRGSLYGVTGGACSNTPIVLAASSDTAALGVRVTDNTRRWTCPSLVCDPGPIGPVLEFYFGTDGSSTVAPLNVTGPVAFNAAPTVRVRAGALGVTTGDGYPLMTWGSMTGTPPDTSNLQLEPASWVAGTLSVVGNTLYLQITATTEPLRWAAGNGTWDNFTYAMNWMNSASPASLIYFQDGDAVQFEDTQNAGGGIIAIDGTVSPASVLVNSTNDYTFTNGLDSIIAGDGSFTKTGSGTLTVGGPGGYTFTGGLSVNGGTLVAAKPNGTAYGACGNGNVVVNNGGRIIANGDNSMLGLTTSAGKTITINAGGVVTNTGTSSGHLNRLVLNGGTLGANTPNATYGNWNLDQGVTTLGTANTSTILGGNVTLSQPGGTVFNVLASDTLSIYSALDRTAFGTDTGLIKNGGGTLSLLGSCTSTGATFLNAGTLALGTSQCLPAGALNLGPGTLAATDAAPRTFTNAVILNLAASVTTFGNASGTGPLTFTGPASVLAGATGRGFVTQADVEFSGAFTGSNGAFTKTGAGRLTLSGAASVNWTGGWNINAGALIVNGTLTSTSAVTIASSARLGGTGTINAPVVVNSGGLVAPGASLGTLTLSNAPAWTGATIQMELNQTNAQTADKLQRTSGGFNFTGTTLTLVNTGPSLTNGVFTLFSAGNTGGFAVTNLPVLDASLAWDFSTLLTDGTLKIVSGKPSTPTNVSWSLSGNQLALSWPASYLGWTLQSQTNSLAVGLSDNWHDVPGTAAVTNYSVTVDSTLPAVFYRLRY